MLGRAMCERFAASGLQLVTASHQIGADFVFDLGGNETLPDEAFQNVSHGVICSGITSRKQCVDNPVETRRFNVDRTIAVLADLISRNIVPVFISSDAVFADREQAYREDDPVAPQSAYGEHKAAVEAYLAGQTAPYLVLRLSKIYSTDDQDCSVVAQWRRALNAGEHISAAYDQYITPTAADDVAVALEDFIRKGLRGVYHVAASEHLTRMAFAELLAEENGRADLIKPCSIDDVNFVEPLPKKVILDSNRLQSATGFCPRPFSQVWKTMRARGSITGIAESTERLRQWAAGDGLVIDDVLDQLLIGRDSPRDMDLVKAFLRQALPAGNVFVFGAGSHTAEIMPTIQSIERSQVVGVVDSHTRFVEDYLGHRVYAIADTLFDQDAIYLLSHHDSEKDMRSMLVQAGVGGDRIFSIYDNPDYIAFCHAPFVQKLNDQIETYLTSGLLKSVDHVIVCSGGEPWTLMPERHLSEIFPADRTLKIYSGRAQHFWNSAFYPTISICQAQSVLGELLAKYEPRTVYIQTSLQFFTQSLGLIARRVLPQCLLVAEVYDWYATFNNAALQEMYACPLETLDVMRDGELLLTQAADLIISKCGGELWDQFVELFEAKYELYYPALGDHVRSFGDTGRTPHSGALKTVFAGSLGTWRAGEAICSENACNNSISLFETLASGPNISVSIYNSAHRSEAVDGDFSYYMENFARMGIQYHRGVPYPVLIDLLTHVDFGLVLTSEANPDTFPYDNALAGLPNRFMGYVEAGVPVIANASLRFCADLMEKYNAGVAVEWGEMDQLAEKALSVDAFEQAQGMNRMRTDMIECNLALIQQLSNYVK